jgi:tripartite motif-containing protein 71
MAGWRFLIPVFVIALCMASCSAGSPAPVETPATRLDTLAPSRPPEAESAGQPAQLVWRSSPWVTLAWPLDVAVAKDGRVYVRDVDNDNIQALDADGYLTKSWGKLGTGDGEFDFHDKESEHQQAVGGLAVVEDTVFVADKNRVQMFDLDGNYVGSWSSRGRKPGQILKTSHMAARFNGNIYILDSTLARIQVFTPKGELATGWPVRFKNLQYLSAICANPNGDVFVAEEFVGVAAKGQSGVRIHKFSRTGDLVQTWGKPNDEDGEFDDGEFVVGTDGMACGDDGRIYVSDVKADRVQVFDSDGHFLFSFTGPARSKPNGAIAIGDDGVIVTDTGSGSVSKFRIIR